MAEIKFAAVITEDDKTRRYCMPIDVVFKDKRDTQHIVPKDVDDFDENHVYYVYWRSCKTMCKVKDKCCSFYKANIISLGG